MSAVDVGAHSRAPTRWRPRRVGPATGRTAVRLIGIKLRENADGDAIFGQVARTYAAIRAAKPGRWGRESAGRRPGRATPTREMPAYVRPQFLSLMPMGRTAVRPCGSDFG